MKNIYDVLRQKEQQSEQLLKEIEVLRQAAKILEAAEPTAVTNKPDSRSNGNAHVPEPASVAGGTPSKRFP